MNFDVTLLKPIRLRTHRFSNLLGLQEDHPYLQWELATGEHSIVPESVQILVADSVESLNGDQGNIWDSGWIQNAQENKIRFPIRCAASLKRLWWKVRVITNTGVTSQWSETSWWEFGLLDKKDWIARWITTDVTGGPRTSCQAPYLRKVFKVPVKPLRARLSITALGLYEAYVNGKVITEDLFTPGWTDYKKRVQIQTYDVIDFLKLGENAIGAILGDGWYCGFVNNGNRQQYGLRPALLAQLQIDYPDGTSHFIASDETWRYSTGPILENDLLMGESYDARLDLGNWSFAGFDDSSWRTAHCIPTPDIACVASDAPRVRRREIFLVNTPLATSRDTWKRSIFDLGQNIAGRVKIHVRGKRGSHFQIRFAEMLDSDGQLYTENLRTARCIDQYTCGGDNEEFWEPLFTFHGFRYVEVAAADHSSEVLGITGIALYTDLEETGEFSCSSTSLNQLFKNINWGMKGNFLEVPTDCPQRDERQGWTGDAQVFASTASFLHDVEGFFNKWLIDLTDAQLPNGQVTAVAPHVETVGNDGGPAWADALIICPWEIYLAYGDTEILRRHYSAMVRFLNYLRDYRIKDHIRSHPDMDPWGGHGDWLAQDGGVTREGNTPKDLIGTAFLAYDLELMSNIARVLHQMDDAVAFENWRKEVLKAFCRRFVTGDGFLVGKTQTAYILALHFKLLPESLRPNAARELAQDIEKRGWHLSTGFVGTPYICQVLEDNGYLDVAYRLIEQDSFPSWLFSVKNGATTIWERWDGWTPDKGFQTASMNSFNHYAYGAVGAWMVHSIAGITLDSKHPGGSHLIFKPRPGGSICQAQAKWHTSRGWAQIQWRKEPDAVEVFLTIPSYAKGTLMPPEGYAAEQTLFGSGVHQITLRQTSSVHKLNSVEAPLRSV